MRGFSNSFEAAQSLAARAQSKVAIQRRIISVMVPDDPALPYAHAVLRQLEQSASMAAMGQILSWPETTQASQIDIGGTQSNLSSKARSDGPLL